MLYDRLMKEASAPPSSLRYGPGSAYNTYITGVLILSDNSVKPLVGPGVELDALFTHSMMMANTQLDVLALAAHPDDIELCAGGTMCLLASQGYRTGIIDFTRGELGSRGTPELRDTEAAEAASIMGLSYRRNLGLPDGDIRNEAHNQRSLIRLVRETRPHIVLINAPDCRHPDHVAAAELATSALFYGGLRKIETRSDDDLPQEQWRPHHVLHYMQSVPFTPSLVVDVSSVWDQRMAALKAFKSQFFNPDYEPALDEPETFVSNPEFFEWITARARTYGYHIGATFGEPFLYRHGPIGVTDLVRSLERERPYR
jgi:N-acetylglucosamine malate deacetylase 1